MRKSILNLLLLVAFLLGNNIVVPAEEDDVVKMLKYAEYNNYGVHFYNAGQYNKALYYFNKAIQLFPNQGPDTYEFRAKVYCKFKRYNKAWDDVKRAQSMKVEVYDGKKLQSKVHEVDPVFLEELRRASGREK